MKPGVMVVLIAVSVVVLLMSISACSGQAPRTALVNGKLRPCPGTPNCVSSESPEDASGIAPLGFSGNPDDAWARAQRAVAETGGRIHAIDGNHLWATYTSRFFRFVDDLELRLDQENGVIHVRSASRVGYSDLGVNRKRVEMLRERFEQ